MGEISEKFQNAAAAVSGRLSGIRGNFTSATSNLFEAPGTQDATSTRDGAPN
jgi:hypothetical protein